MAARLTVLLLCLFCFRVHADLGTDINTWTGSVYIAISGDSIPAGYGLTNYALGQSISNAFSPVIESTNVAVPGDTWANLAANQLTNALATSPRYLFVHCGVNDVQAGTTWANVLAKMNTTMAACNAYGTRLLLGEIFPDTNFDDSKAATIRQWNTNYAAWAATNSGAYLVTQHDSFGQTRGSTGLLDDLKAAYNQGDGVHLSQSAYDAWGPIIVGRFREIHSGVFYVSQGGSGSTNSVAWFNAAANWGSEDGKIGPGDTVWLFGTITTGLIVQGSGSSGNPITIKFAPSAKFSAESWTGKAIDVSSRDWITINGGATGLIGSLAGNTNLVNGVIECTANGTELANKADAQGVAGADAHHITVTGLLIQNLYVRVSGAEQNGYGSGVYASAGVGTAPSDWTVTNCVLHDMAIGFSFNYGAGSSNVTFSHCTAYNVNWGANAGNSGATSTMTNLTVESCYFHDFANWDDTSEANSWHHNGFFGWAETGGTLSGVTLRGNMVEADFGSRATSGMYLSGSGVQGAQIYNNVFKSSGASGALYLMTGDNCTMRVMNNTFLGTAGNLINISGFAGSNQTFYVDNNLLTNGVFFVAHNGSIALDSDYNIFTGVELSSSPTGASATYTFEQWQAQGWDAHSTTNAPTLDASYVPTAEDTVARDKGLDLSAYFTTDYTGATRTVPWDIGAYEYGAAAPAGGGTQAVGKGKAGILIRAKH